MLLEIKIAIILGKEMRVNRRGDEGFLGAGEVLFFDLRDGCKGIFNFIKSLSFIIF